MVLLLLLCTLLSAVHSAITYKVVKSGACEDTPGCVPIYDRDTCRDALSSLFNGTRSSLNTKSSSYSYTPTGCTYDGRFLVLSANVDVARTCGYSRDDCLCQCVPSNKCPPRNDPSRLSTQGCGEGDLGASCDFGCVPGFLGQTATCVSTNTGARWEFSDGTQPKCAYNKQYCAAAGGCDASGKGTFCTPTCPSGQEALRAQCVSDPVNASQGIWKDKYLDNPASWRGCFEERDWKFEKVGDRTNRPTSCEAYSPLCRSLTSVEECSQAATEMGQWKIQTANRMTTDYSPPACYHEGYYFRFNANNDTATTGECLGAGSWRYVDSSSPSCICNCTVTPSPTASPTATSVAPTLSPTSGQTKPPSSDQTNETGKINDAGRASSRLDSCLLIALAFLLREY